MTILYNFREGPYNASAHQGLPVGLMGDALILGALSNMENNF